MGVLGLQASTSPLTEGVMNAFLLQYLPILVFLAVAVVLGALFIVGAWALAPKHPDPEKISAYECGFNAFEDARMKFDVRFYLVAILFIIFDLEVAFLFPWAVSLMKMPHASGLFAFWSMLGFLGVLTVGFIYEWKKGALEWE
jgi:NADH-quinone oxidoreductase subunit A